MKPKRGELWFIEFEPQIGAEIQKIRPGVVLSIQELAGYPLRIVMPIRDYKEHHEEAFHFVSIEPSSTNGLTKKSSIDCLQIKSFDTRRFKNKIGKLTEKEIKQVLTALIVCVGYEHI
jgi:mRNA interferase MazF